MPLPSTATLDTTHLADVSQSPASALAALRSVVEIVRQVIDETNTLSSFVSSNAQNQILETVLPDTGAALRYRVESQRLVLEHRDVADTDIPNEDALRGQSQILRRVLFDANGHVFRVDAQILGDYLQFFTYPVQYASYDAAERRQNVGGTVSFAPDGFEEISHTVEPRWEAADGTVMLGVSEMLSRSTAAPLQSFSFTDASGTTTMRPASDFPTQTFVRRALIARNADSTDDDPN